LFTFRTQQFFAAAVASDLSQEVYRRTLMQPYSFHVRHNSSDLIGAITQDVGSVGGGCFALYPDAGGVNSLVVVGIALTLVAIDPGITLGVAIFLAVAYGVLLRLTNRRLARMLYFIRVRTAIVTAYENFIV